MNQTYLFEKSYIRAAFLPDQLRSKLEELYNIALDGNMDGILACLDDLKQKNPNYGEFCN